MIADGDSRKVNLNEEYIPARFFKKICERVGLSPTVDMMATSDNRRTSKFVNRGPTNHKDALAYDVFSVETTWVKNEILYFFPPKNVRDRVLHLILNRFMDFKILLVFHLFEEYPQAFGRLVRDPRVKIRYWRHAPLAIIPDDKVLHFDQKVSYTIHVWSINMDTICV